MFYSEITNSENFCATNFTIDKVIMIIAPIGFPCIFYSIQGIHIIYLRFLLTGVLLVDSEKSFHFNFRFNTLMHNVE